MQKDFSLTDTEREPSADPISSHTVRQSSEDFLMFHSIQCMYRLDFRYRLKMFVSILHKYLINNSETKKSEFSIIRDPEQLPLDSTWIRCMYRLDVYV